MARDLFGEISDPSVRVESRKWYTVPLSLAIHTLVLFIVIVIPLMATGVLPVPASGPLLMPVAPVSPPAPPPMRRAAPDAAPASNVNVAPVVAPDAIAPEIDLQAGFEGAVPGVSDVPGGGVIDGVGVVVGPPPPVAAGPQEPVRLGGNIKRPERLTYVAPVYSAIALAARVKGAVIIEAIIGTDGRVQHARVLRSVALLDQSALDAVRQWTYTPTLLNGIPVPVIMTVTVQFQLQ